MFKLFSYGCMVGTLAWSNYVLGNQHRTGDLMAAWFMAMLVLWFITEDEYVDFIFARDKERAENEANNWR